MKYTIECSRDNFSSTITTCHFCDSTFFVCENVNTSYSKLIDIHGSLDDIRIISINIVNIVKIDIQVAILVYFCIQEFSDFYIATNSISQVLRIDFKRQADGAPFISLNRALYKDVNSFKFTRKSS